MNRPNILFIFTDQLRYDALSCTGDWVKTPHIDSLASEGTLFTNCVTNSPVCIPTRLSLATGLYPHTTGVWNNCESTLSEDSKTWMQVIRDAGYRTSLFGKTHLHPHKGDLRDREYLMHAYGLDDVDEIGGPRASTRVLSYMTEEWKNKGLWEAYQEDYKERFANKPYIARPSALPLEDYADVYVGRKADEYLKNYDRTEPWFCWVSFGGPHEPWDTPEPYASMYNPEDMPLATNAPVSKENINKGQLDHQIDKAPQPTNEDIQAMRADYAGNVTLIDDQIGKLIETIKLRGEWENTVVVFTSDHGEMNGDAGLIYKSNFLKGSVHVPLIIRTPESIQRSAQICRSPVELFDIGPTMAEYAGKEITHQQCAESLCSLVDSPEKLIRPDAISEIDEEIMIFDGEWKYAVNKEKQPYLLFNTKTDPQESQNLIGVDENKDIENRLHQRLLERIA